MIGRQNSATSVPAYDLQYDAIQRLTHRNLTTQSTPLSIAIGELQHFRRAESPADDCAHFSCYLMPK